MLPHFQGRPLGRPWLFFFVAWAAGCGGRPSLPDTRVEGKVLLNGEPVDSARVSFFWLTGHSHNALVEPDGSYTLAHAPEGEAQVAVVGFPKPQGGLAGAPIENQAELLAKRILASSQFLPVSPAIPKHYADPETSGLSYVVRTGRQTFDIELTTPGSMDKPAKASTQSAKLGIRVGQLAPDIQGQDLDGVEFKLSDFRGKIVVLAFWGHW
jgi:hypothetical protein